MSMSKNVLVAIAMGSDSDSPVMEEAGKIFDEFGIGYETKITSAHRSPDHAISYFKGLEKKGIKIVIAAASYSAHLPGVAAANTTLPVIGVPLDASPLKGLDALFAMGQMPPGIPVATMTIGKAGAKNAAHFALEILALHDEELRTKLHEYRKRLAEEVEAKNKK